MSHVARGGYGDTALIPIVDGAVEVIDDSFVVKNERFVGEQVVVWFGGCDQVIARPVGPVLQVVGAGKTVERLSLFAFPERSEIEHDIKFSYFDDLGVTGDPSLGMVQNRTLRIAFPVHHVVGDCNADTFASCCIALGIVEHDERRPEQMGRNPKNRTLV